MNTPRVLWFVLPLVFAGGIAGLPGCAPSPKDDRTAEVAIAPAPPVGSSHRGDDRPPLSPRSVGVFAPAEALGDEDRERDPRIRQFPRRMLEAEAEQLSLLFAQTSRGSPDYGLVLLRLAHACGAAEGAAWHEGDAQGAEKARRAALGYYERFLKELPTHPNVAEAFYFAGLEEERLHRLDHARKYWFKVVSEHPTHKLVPACYYGFGVLFRADAVSDPAKLAFAQQAFREVAKYPGSPLAERAKSQLAGDTREEAAP